MTEPIAVIGLDAKLPCDGDTVEEFFEFLVAGRSAKAPVPKDRYNAEAFWHPDNHRDGVASLFALKYPVEQKLLTIVSTHRSVAKKVTL